MAAVFTLLIQMCILAFFQAIGITQRPDEVMYIPILIFTGAYVFYVLKSKKLYDVRSAFLLGYFFRLVLLFWDIYKPYSLPASGADATGFYDVALGIAQGIPDGYGGYFTKLAGWSFKTFGTSKIYMQFLFLCCSVLALHIAHQILLETNVDGRCRKFAMTVLCLLPNFAITSVIFRREGVILTILAISLLFFVRWMNGSSELCFWMAVAVGFVGSIFHGGEVGVPIGYLFVHFLYNRKLKKFHVSFFSITTSIIVALIVVFLYNNYGDVFFGKVSGIEDISDIAHGSEGGSSYTEYVGNSNSLLNMIIYTPLRIVFYQFTPFIWQLRGINDAIAMCFNAWFYLCVWVITIKYIVSRAPKNREIIIAIFIVVLFITFIFAWGVTNTGTAIRHREKIIIFYGVLLGLVLDGRPERQRPKAKRTPIRGDIGTWR